MLKAVATSTDGTNLVLRFAHIRGVPKLAAPSALDRVRDKGSNVVKGTSKLNVIGQGEGSVHYLDVGGRYVALQGMAPTEHTFSRHNFVNRQKGPGRDSSWDIWNYGLDGGGEGLFRDKGNGFVIKLFEGGKHSEMFDIIYCDCHRLA